MNKLNLAQVEQLKEIGSYLRQKRLEESLSLEQIAARTHIRLQMLRAIEEGDRDGLPELVYIQGFIRRYGEVLKIDGNSLAKTLSLNEDEINPDLTYSENLSEIISVPSTSANPNLPRRKNLANYWPYLLLLGGAIAALSYLVSRFPLPAPKPEPIVEKVVPPIVKASPSPSPSPKPKPPAQNAPVSVSVKLEESSWMRIQADGKAVFEGMVKKGEQKTWTAKEKLTLRAGNAGAVKVSANQQPAQILGNLGEVKEVTFTP